KKRFLRYIRIKYKIMNIAKLIFKSDEQLNILLPQASNYKNTNYFPQELELKKKWMLILMI
ncbi:hypothetical protein OLT15_05765, partial [Campylobacter jejuni]|nr:hypothetical protein [Campylobacter jejuni]